LQRLGSFERPTLFEAFCGEKESESDDKNADGDRGAKGPVIGGAKKALDDVRDHRAAGTTDKNGSEKVAERENESEGGAGDEPGKGERENYFQKSFGTTRTEILRSFEERARNIFKGGVNRKKNERCVDVREHQNDREWTVEEKFEWRVGDVKILQRAVENAVAAENGFPGVAADEVADPERDDDELIEKFFASPGAEGKIVRERIAEEEREKSDGGSNAHGAKENLKIDGIGEKSFVVLEIPVVNEEAIADEPETVGEHQAVGKEEEKAYPDERRERGQRFVGA